MTCYDDAERDGSRRYSYVVVYGDGGGGGRTTVDRRHVVDDGDRSDDASSDVSTCPDWTDDADSNNGNDNTSGGSVDGGSAGDGSVSEGSAADGGKGARGKADKMAAGYASNRNKWLKTLWTMIDRMEGEHRNRNNKRVKTILRPPTTYAYVIGMSGLPSKVPVYPKRM